MIDFGSLNYNGTDYRVLRVTDDAIALGSNGNQEIWVTKEWLRSQGMAVRVGRNPASLYL